MKKGRAVCGLRFNVFFRVEFCLTLLSHGGAGFSQETTCFSSSYSSKTRTVEVSSYLVWFTKKSFFEWKDNSLVSNSLYAIRRCTPGIYFLYITTSNLLSIGCSQKSNQFLDGKEKISFCCEIDAALREFRMF